MNDLSILGWLLSSSRSIDIKDYPSLYLWKNVFFDEKLKWKNTIDMAIAGSFLSDRLAYAFAAGYWSALYRLIPALPEKTITAFCVSEEGGNHPKAIKTELTAHRDAPESTWLLNGSKKFVTCVREAKLLLIAASTGISSNGQSRLRLIRIDDNTSGLTLNPFDQLPFIPEISYGEIKLNNIEVRENQILPGDGYTSYIKPFRTLEDLHITASILGFLFRIASVFEWPKDTKEQMLALITCIKALSQSNPLDNRVHIYLGGLLRLFDSFIVSIEPMWKHTDDSTRSRWHRDKALLTIAGKVRAQRLSKAWSYHES